MPRIVVSQSLTQNGWPKLYKAQVVKNLVGKTPINVNERTEKTEELNSLSTNFIFELRQVYAVKFFQKNAHQIKNSLY